MNFLAAVIMVFVAGNQMGNTQRSLVSIRKFLRYSAIAAVLGLTLTTARVAHAALNIGVDTSYSGTAPGSPTTPWVNSLFQDIAANTVRLTITAPNLSNPQYLQSLYLNFNDTKQVTSLTFTPVFSLWQGVENTYNLQLGRNSEQAANGGSYDILLGFSAAPGNSRRFGNGDQVVFDITTSEPNTSLTSFDFAMRSTPGSAGSFYEAAFIQRTGFNNKENDFAGATTFTVLGVPEPVSGFAAAGLCFIALGLYIRRDAWRRFL